MVNRTNNERDYMFLDENKTLRLFDDAVVWKDAKFPFTGNRVNVSGGRVDYNYFNGGVDFQNNARFDALDCISMLWQVNHDVQLQTNVKPHFHWLQTSSAEPNWLIAYKKIKNGESYTKETTYNNHTLLTKASNAFTYTSGTLVQLTSLPEIDMSDMIICGCIHFAFFRDVFDASGLFGGAESAPVTEMAFEFDVHEPIDSLGSEFEFIKLTY